MLSITLILVVVSVLLFIAGLGIGWIYSDSDDPELSMKTKVRTAIAIAVTLIWIVSLIVEMVVLGYTVSPLVHAIMGAIVGYFFSEDGLTFKIGGDK